MDSRFFGNVGFFNLLGRHAAFGYPRTKGSSISEHLSHSLYPPLRGSGVLSILILKGVFNQEFGAVNALLRGIFGFAPEWETNPWGARAMILIVNLWLGYPYMMLICTGHVTVNSVRHL